MSTTHENNKSVAMLNRAQLVSYLDIYTHYTTEVVTQRIYVIRIRDEGNSSKVVKRAESLLQFFLTKQQEAYTAIIAVCSL